MTGAGKASCRLPSGHPEAFLEAFANVYTAAYKDMIARASGQKVDGSKSLYPNVADGVDGMKIHKAIQALFKKCGYPTEIRKGKNVGFFHGTGHGLGLEIHEYPRLQKVILKDRQCLTVEPGLYYPGLGGVRHEDVVVVTKTGCKILSRFPKQLEI